MFSKQQLSTICRMQDEMNILAAGADWKTKNLPWDVALFREAGEAIDHLNWEWWKKTTPNTEQAKLEVVDMLHFAVSGAIIQTQSSDILFDFIEENLQGMRLEDKETLDALTVIQTLQEIAFHAYAGSNYVAAIMFVVYTAEKLDMSIDDLFEGYIAKNVLNRFRKANGYKEGTYQKLWDTEGNEDNVYLSKLLSDDRTNGVISTPESLMDRLTDIYKDVPKSVN